MTATAIKAAITDGMSLDVTNHYITREDHPCFGTRRVKVDRVTGSSLWLNPGGRVEWPKASQIQRSSDGAVLLFGGGIGQADDALFLTLRPVDAR